jgi:hypothetical protein
MNTDEAPEGNWLGYFLLALRVLVEKDLPTKVHGEEPAIGAREEMALGAALLLQQPS